MRFIAALLLLLTLTVTRTFSQCPTSGTISSNCTTTGNLTISGNTLTVNSGVTVTVTGTLTIKAASTLNATGAIFNIGGFADGNGSPNTVTGGTYNTGSFSTGGGGSFTMNGATVSISPSDDVTIAGSAIVINNSTFTGVDDWNTNASSLTMSSTNITADGSIEFEDANITGGTFITGTTFSTTNGTNAMSGVTIDVGTSASIKNTTFTNTNLDVVGVLEIESGEVSFDNSTINTGTGNAGTNDEDALDMNGGGELTLTGDSQMNIRGSVTNNEFYIDDSDVIVTGDFNNDGNEILDVYNGGTINIQGDFDNSGNGNVFASDGGFIDVDGDYDNSGGGDTDVDGGTFVVGGTYDGDSPTGDSGDCTGGSGGCCGSGCGSLPVTLIDFNSTFNNSIIELNWSTATELNNNYFTIDRSFNGSDFSEITRVSGSGTTNEVTNYSYQEESSFAAQFVYYRLSQTDYDGTHKNLKVVVMQIDQFADVVQVYPNPIKKGQLIQIMGMPVETNWTVYSLSGQVVDYGKLSSTGKIDSSDLQAGTYLLQLDNEFDSHVRRIIIK